ncbi:MAG: RNA polymerase sigma factor [Gammaproteobacteria bacterium]|nr:RNA polymerase sigma factor [Gammaproteobacteria bacterium]
MTKPPDQPRCHSGQGYMDDNVLLAKYISGDDEALTTLVERHQKALYRFICRQVVNEADAADVTQQVFVSLFLKAKQFEGKSSFKTWLYQIAVNLCKNHFRSNDRRKEIGSDNDALEVVQDDTKADDYILSEYRNILKSAISKLPEKQRATMQLRVYHECTFSEIADIMSSSPGTVKACYHQAVLSLMKSLKEGAYAPTEL